MSDKTIKENNVSFEGDIPEPADTNTIATIIANTSFEDMVETAELCTDVSYSVTCMICEKAYIIDDVYSTPKLICPTCIGKLRKLMNIEVDEE